ncbi:hypothetical protein AVEN_11218-1 [Araneus ventricosus]|uniref:Uncharacterized protein n=1 Tax=Araneus ventricosus TaxID=182803 RepID=A0A4Y2QDR2_ARAVE|nr:hypothetical protein AVEN_11218-1 [Araneus ventricosus]
MTASGLLVHQRKLVCIFCSKSHNSLDCFVAQKISLEEKQRDLKGKMMFPYLKFGHNSKRYKAILKCIISNRHHVPVMCPILTTFSEKRSEDHVVNEEGSSGQGLTALSSFSKSLKVFSQTLLIDSKGSHKCIRVWAFREA